MKASSFARETIISVGMIGDCSVIDGSEQDCPWRDDNRIFPPSCSSLLPKDRLDQSHTTSTLLQGHETTGPVLEV